MQTSKEVALAELHSHVVDTWSDLTEQEGQQVMVVTAEVKAYLEGKNALFGHWYWDMARVTLTAVSFIAAVLSAGLYEEGCQG